MSEKDDKPCSVGILLVCHGDLGKQFIAAAKIIYEKPIECVSALSIKANYERQTVLDKACEKLKQLASECSQIIVMFDAYGVTAARLVSSLEQAEKLQIQCVFGVNLPMLLDCIAARETDIKLEQLAEHVCKSGKDAITYSNLQPENAN